MKSAEMKPHLAIAAMLLGMALATGTAQAQNADDGWHALFNGADLTGWTNSTAKLLTLSKTARSSAPR